MKDSLIKSIVCMLDSMDVDTEGVADKLYILMKDIEKCKHLKRQNDEQADEIERLHKFIYKEVLI